MEHVLCSLEDGIVGLHGPDVAPFQRDMIPGVVREVLLPAAEEVVDGSDGEAFADEQVHHVAADETRAARDDRNGALHVNGARDEWFS
jgi:hypothetical protein